MNKQSSSKLALLIVLISFACAWSSAALTIAMHATSERSGAQGNLLSFAAQHTGNLPDSSRMFFYAVNSAGVTENLSYTTNPVGDLWWKSWIAKSPGTYTVYAVLRRGFSEDDLEIARTTPITVEITGSAIAMHSSSERTFVSGKASQAVAVTFGQLPSNARAFFYAVDTATERTYPLGYQDSVLAQLWYRPWTPTLSTTYYIYAVLRLGISDDSPEIARSGNFIIVPKGTKVPLPFEAVEGTYQALLPGPQQPMLIVRLAGGGAVSGRMVLNGLTYPLKGRLAGDGTATLRSDLRAQPSLSLLLRSDGQSLGITGTYTIGAQTPVEFSLLPRAYAGKGDSVSPLARKTANVILVPELAAGREFLGYGYARATFDAKGGARVVGALPDGRKLSAYAPALSSGLPEEPVLPVMVAWKGTGMATLKGEWQINESADGAVPLVEGNLALDVPADSKRKILPQAFQATFASVGNLWAPGSGANALTGGIDTVDFLLQGDADKRILGEAAAVSGSWASDNRPSLSNLPTGSTWTFSAKSGLFSGRLVQPDGTYIYSGLVVPFNGFEAGGRNLRGAGFMLGKSASAEVEITTAD